MTNCLFCSRKIARTYDLRVHWRNSCKKLKDESPEIRDKLKLLLEAKEDTEIIISTITDMKSRNSFCHQPINSQEGESIANALSSTREDADISGISDFK
mmetsp:Transcript_25/g.27  ORF Transcript_25/g.27 Transcript_25/m.27 type:complete len:99 (-) Transcript_25:705-1001(-)